MRDRAAIRQRYLRDPVPRRLGGLAANLSRITSFSHHDGNRQAVAELIEESKFMIEWTAADAGMEVAADLVELQVQLARWQRNWLRIWADPAERKLVAEHAAMWSRRTLKLSGLL